jgi:selenocysteine lyase/cysteine desulfurase
MSVTAAMAARYSMPRPSWPVMMDRMNVHELAASFPPARGFLNTASLGLPSEAGVAAIERHLADWRRGRSQPPDFDDDVNRSRRAYATLVGVEADAVATLSQVSVATGLVASSLPDGATVLCAEEDFTSVLFPFLADRRLRVRSVPLERLVASIDPEVDLVAVSLVQSADGRRLDADALAAAAATAGARTFVDVTQAAGWMQLDARPFDVTACGAYKWLGCPRGAAFVTVTPAATEWLVPRHAGWYAGGDPWLSIYGPPLRLADDARRYDTSPAWIAWVGSAPTLELLAATGMPAVEHHDVGLANQLRDRLDLARSDSPIVSVEVAEGADALDRAGIRCANRAGKVRLSFHHYNTVADVDLVVEALGTTVER